MPSTAVPSARVPFEPHRMRAHRARTGATGRAGSRSSCRRRGRTTRSPGRRFARGSPRVPTSSTVPAPSWPRMSGGGIGTLPLAERSGRSGRRRWRRCARGRRAGPSAGVDHLFDRPSARCTVRIAARMGPPSDCRFGSFASRVSESNRRHLLYKRSALPTELTRRADGYPARAARDRGARDRRRRARRSATRCAPASGSTRSRRSACARGATSPRPSAPSTSTSG